MSKIFSRRSIRYSLSALVTSKSSCNFLLYKRSEQVYWWAGAFIFVATGAAASWKSVTCVVKRETLVDSSETGMRI